jgi:heme-degrading monooxygenase HmoA
MFMVIFEVQPKTDRWDDYLALAKQLRPKLEAIDGFIDNERFASKRTKGRLLSLSTWRDEKSVVRWRTHGEHHDVQGKGRFKVFEDYHLRVGEVTLDSAPPNGLPAESGRSDETEIGAAKFCKITEVPPLGDATAARASERLQQPDANATGLLDHELFESITRPGKLLVLASWRDGSAAAHWHPNGIAGTGEIRHRQVRVIRDYGMFDRREAPQFYPDVATDKRP